MKKPSLPIIMLLSAGAVLVVLMIVVALLRTIEDPPPIFIPDPTPTQRPIRIPTSNARPTAPPASIERDEFGSEPSPLLTDEDPRSMVPGPERDPDEPPLPYQISATVPEDLWISIEDNTSSTEAHTLTTFESNATGFTIEVESNISRIDPETNLGYQQSRPYGTVYPYVEDDFVQIAVVDGIELYVSKTGATTFADSTSETSEYILAADDEIVSAAEAASRTYRYAVYQRYLDGLSPYLSIYQYDEPPEVPLLSRYVFITYWTTDTGSEIDWDTYQSTLVDLLNSLEPFDNEDRIE